MEDRETTNGPPLSAAGERRVLLSEADYAAPLDAAEDKADREALVRFREALART